MDEVHTNLADRAIQAINGSNDYRIIIALAGVPGSGKTTLSHKVVSIINNRKITESKGEPIKAIAVGMDGFHLSRLELNQLPDPELAHLRRGAPYTFAAEKVVSFSRLLGRSSPLTVDQREHITVPSFDHKLKDPTPNGIVIDPDVNIIIFEGLYLLLDIAPWNEIQGFVHERWFIDVDQNEARERLVKRHLEAGIESTLKNAYRRVDQNDQINAVLIKENLVDPINVIVRST